VLPCLGGMDTRQKQLQWRIARWEERLHHLVGRANPPLSCWEQAEQIEEQLCLLYQALDSCDLLPRVAETAREIEALRESDFLCYLGWFGDEDVVGWAGSETACPIAVYITEGSLIRTEGLEVRVGLSSALVTDGYDATLARLPPFAERVARLCTPPLFVGRPREPITAARLRHLMASAEAAASEAPPLQL
jgi:hypothetical protein